MRTSATDPYEAVMKRGGFTEAFLERQRERKRAEDQARIDADLLQQFKSIAEARRVPRWVADIIVEAAAAHGVPALHLVGRNTKRAIVAARHEAIYQIKAAKRGLTTPRIAAFFGMDHTSILYSLARHAEKHGLPRLSCYNIAYERRRKAAIRHFDMKRAA